MNSFAYGLLSPFNQVRHIDLYMVYDDDDDDNADARESLRNPTTRILFASLPTTKYR